MPTPEADIASPLTDLTKTSLEDLRLQEDETLRVGLRRMMDGLDDPDSSFGSGFSS